jgi:type IV pilus assembly protein PilC
VVFSLLVFGIIQTHRGRYGRDKLFLAMPVFGTIQFALVERFCRILSSMVSAGVQLPEALRVATGSLPNLVFRRSLGEAGEALWRGRASPGHSQRPGCSRRPRRR